jgi:N-acetylmuramoyl-L-alanine amidase
VDVFASESKHRRESTRRRARVVKIQAAVAALALVVASCIGLAFAMSGSAPKKAPAQATRTAAAATHSSHKSKAHPHRTSVSHKTTTHKSPAVASAPAKKTPAVVASSAKKHAVTRATAAVSAANLKRAAAAAHRMVVVIDAGHQANADLRPEPIGPGSSTTKPRVAGGTSGVVTHNPESVVNLKIALRLRSALQKRGVKVIMIRTSQKVDIPNSKRAQIANKAHANLFIRLHCDGVTSSATHGLLTLVPAKNQWTGGIVTSSGRAGRDVQAATLKATAATNRGVVGRGDMSGFNWAKVPSIIVEMGVMTNPTEDRKLASSGYQVKLATGMANGIVRFLSGK